MKREIALFLIALAAVLAVQAKTPLTAGTDTLTLVADSVETDATCEDTHIRASQLVVPGALIAVGALGVENGWLCSVKQDVRKDLQDWRGNHSRMRADDVLQFLPMMANVGLGLTGVKARHSLRERLVATTTAFMAMEVMVKGTKLMVNERRPDSEQCNSFPSGHTARAFMGAELVREEYGNAWGAGAYAFATGIAFIRLYNDRHWLNDVVGGAGIGLLSARIGYWLLPLERRLLGWEHRETSIAFMPSYHPELHAPMLCFAASF